jgi:hypothetical protein
MLKARSRLCRLARLGLSLALGCAAAAIPVLAEEVADLGPPAPAAVTAAGPCDLAPLFEPLAEAGFTPAVAAESWAPGASDLAGPFGIRRTCRCSCGYPCTTNADCGPGGFCSAGITCCAMPPRNDDATPADDRSASPEAGSVAG